MVKNEINGWRDRKPITNTRAIGQLTYWMVYLLEKGYTQEELTSMDKRYRKKAYEIIDKENSVSPQ
ncbi:MAG: hypothetical protein J6S85_06690 [Methanobrevibacter sp.]|nr:hypothetical protein [Methanobrevibacter sp.]